MTPRMFQYMVASIILALLPVVLTVEWILFRKIYLALLPFTGMDEWFAQRLSCVLAWVSLALLTVVSAIGFFTDGSSESQPDDPGF